MERRRPMGNAARPPEKGAAQRRRRGRAHALRARVAAGSSTTRYSIKSTSILPELIPTAVTTLVALQLERSNSGSLAPCIHAAALMCVLKTEPFSAPNHAKARPFARALRAPKHARAGAHTRTCSSQTKAHEAGLKEELVLSS
eukprot:6198653-Pleurochrysis_carterae.AAC.2